MSLPRYPEYKDSGVRWLGEVPAHWAAKPLKAAASINDDALPETTRPDFELSYVDIGSVSLGAGIERTEDFMFSAAPSRARRLVRDGDVIVSTVRTYLRAIAPIVRPPENLVVSTGFAVVRPRNLMDSGFAKYALQSQQFVDQVISRSTGVSYPAINASDLARIELPFPPKEEQSVIATFLDRETAKIGALIAEQEKLLALLAEKRQATISHAVTRGLNPNAPMKDSGISWLGEVPAHWDVRRLKNLSAFTTSGPRGWSEHISENGSLFIQSGDLDDDLVVDFANAKRVTVGEDAEAARTRLIDGDLVICITGAKTGNVAVCGVVPEPAFVNQHLCLVRPSKEVDSRFLGLALKSGTGKTQLDLSQYGLKQGLSLENVRELLIALPPLSEQEVLVAHIDAELERLVALRNEVARAIELLKERRSALISAAVTGKIDVRNAA